MDTTETLQKIINKAQKWPLRSKTATERFLQKHKMGLFLDWTSNQIEVVTDMLEARNFAKN